MTRKPLNLTDKVASALLQIKIGAAGGEWLIPEPTRSTGSAKEILGTVQFDHGVLVAHDGTNVPQNLTPRLTEAHREKSKEDNRRAKKTRRILRKQVREAQAATERADAIRSKILSGLTDGYEPPRQKSRPIAGTKRSGLKKKMNGKVVKRATGEPM